MVSVDTDVIVAAVAGSKAPVDAAVVCVVTDVAWLAVTGFSVGQLL